MKTFAIKGNICYSRNQKELVTAKDSYLVCEEGVCKGVFAELPEKYRGISCEDYGERLIIPGLVDLHVHAPQYPFRGLGMDLELIDWLNTHTFPEERKYQDPEYAEKAYRIFTEDLAKSGTTRACVFATIHGEATLRLMEMLEEAGIAAYVGKVNMDRNSPDYLCEESADASAEATKDWLKKAQGRFANVKPILTPRFIPTCSDALMEKLSEIQKEQKLPVQSHLSENFGEIAWVGELCPETRFYGEAYDRTGMFGGSCPTIMAHCVHSGEEEIRLMKERGVFIAHCPESNANLSSGVAPVRTYLEQGLRVGLGSDVAAGTTLSMFHAMAEAVRCSKLRWRLVDESLTPLRMEEVFYLATKGGGAFFGKVGSFEEGYEFDAVVLDDSSLRHPQELGIRDRLERMIYLADDRNVAVKYCRGKKLSR